MFGSFLVFEYGLNLIMVTICIFFGTGIVGAFSGPTVKLPMFCFGASNLMLALFSCVRTYNLPAAGQMLGNAYAEVKRNLVRVRIDAPEDLTKK